ncbi:hypothetical protein [Roseinatronobacter sp.]|nr:hypothetical protein [Rhodobaca sp.]
MAYINEEIQNFRLIWLTVASRVFVVGLIFAGLIVASMIALLLGHAP